MSLFSSFFSRLRRGLATQRRLRADLARNEWWVAQLRETRPLDADDAVWVITTFHDALLDEAVAVLRSYARPFGASDQPMPTSNPGHPWDRGERARAFLAKYKLDEKDRP